MTGRGRGVEGSPHLTYRVPETRTKGTPLTRRGFTGAPSEGVKKLETCLQEHTHVRGTINFTVGVGDTVGMWVE